MTNLSFDQTVPHHQTQTSPKGLDVPKVLLLGGKGQIGSGLRTFLPRLDPTYEITTIDLPGAEDKATHPDAQQNFIDLDINEDHERLHDCTGGQDLVVYLARRNPHDAMNAMTDLVFNTLLAQDPVPMVVAASSVHACDGAYSVHEGTWAEWANRHFSAYDTPPDRVLATIPACPTSDYGREKAYVEERCQKLAGLGHGAVAARWGGINADNEMREEHGYFALWCHQEDAARFVHACYTSHVNGTLRSGAHYFVVSDNTYNIFDIEIPRKEIGYAPVHNAEVFYQG